MSCVVGSFDRRREIMPNLTSRGRAARREIDLGHQACIEVQRLLDQHGRKIGRADAALKRAGKDLNTALRAWGFGDSTMALAAARVGFTFAQEALTILWMEKIDRPYARRKSAKRDWTKREIDL